jgi:hypothetical protein
MLCVFLLNRVFLYIDSDRMAEEYLHCCKKGDWKRENTKEALKSFNLESNLGS